MGLIYSRNISNVNSVKDEQVLVEDDFVEIKKPVFPILFLNNYINKKHLPIIYESSSDDEDKEYDVDLLDQDKKYLLDSVFGI